MQMWWAVGCRGNDSRIGTFGRDVVGAGTSRSDSEIGCQLWLR